MISLFLQDGAGTTHCQSGKLLRNGSFAISDAMSMWWMMELRNYYDEMLRQGNIRPSQSPAGATILFVPKADGKLRLVVDYRGLNKVTIANKYPIPIMRELRDRVEGSKIFSKLDLKKGYYLVRIKEGDEWKTAFRCRYGHYEYLVMPFGLINAPATFQGMMHKVLREFLDQGVVVYLDDILIYSETEKQHVELMRKVLQRLKNYHLAVNVEKSVFHTQEVEFLGYIVNTEGVEMSEKKVKAIREWKAPTSVREVQIIIEFTNFYRRFIKNFSGLCAPITETL